MSWQVRDGHAYYYLACRRNGRPVNRYIGRGTLAEIAAAQAETRKAEKQRLRQELRETRDRLIPLDKFVSAARQGRVTATRSAHPRSGFLSLLRQMEGCSSCPISGKRR